MLTGLKYKFSIPSLVQITRIAFFASKPSSSAKLDDYFKFPKHEEFFNEDYYNEEEQDPEKQKMGILTKYKKQLQLNEGDIRMRTYHQEFQKFQKQAQGFMESNTSEDLSKFTEQFTLRRRMQKPFEFTEEFREKNMRNEYGNYEKYQKNYADVKNEEISEFETGDTTFLKNYTKFMRSTNLKEGQKVAKLDLVRFNKGLKKKGNPISDIVLRQRQAEIDLRTEIDQANLVRNDGTSKPGYNGRVSPWAKENIYRLYLQGMTVKDLSLKFGLLPIRVKFIVYQKALYWTEIYPKVGESVMRLGIERELLHASVFPFLDYGKDLQKIADQEEGVPDVQFKRTEVDANPPPSVKAHIEKTLSMQKSRVYDYIPEKLIGTGPRSYLLYDWHIMRGKGAHKPSHLFAKTVRYGIKEPNMLPKKVAQRLKKTGPRVATLGYGLR